MPKKTRKEKIISQLKRQLQVQQATVTTPKYVAPTQNTVSSVKTDYSHVKSDLKRISLVSLGALLFEIALYFILNKR